MPLPGITGCFKTDFDCVSAATSVKRQSDERRHWLIG